MTPTSSLSVAAQISARANATRQAVSAGAGAIQFQARVIKEQLDRVAADADAASAFGSADLQQCQTQLTNIWDAAQTILNTPAS